MTHEGIVYTNYVLCGNLGASAPLSDRNEIASQARNDDKGEGNGETKAWNGGNNWNETAS